MIDSPLVIPIVPSLSLTDMLELILSALARILIALLAVIAAIWLCRNYVIARRQKRSQCKPIGLAGRLARMRRRMHTFSQFAAARREFARLDTAALRDLGIGSSEFSSYWAEATGIAERTRRRASSCTANDGDLPRAFMAFRVSAVELRTIRRLGIREYC